MIDQAVMAGADEADLVFALCHEIGNLIGAVRLHAHLLDDDMGARDLALASVELDDLSARASALLAHMRPLLSSDPAGGGGCAPAAIVRAVQQLLDEQGGRGTSIVLRIEAGLPLVEVEPEVLNHLLESFLFAALESAGAKGAVALRAERCRGGVAFVVEDDGEVIEDPTLWRNQSRRGRPLLCGVAENILAKRGGRVEVSNDGAVTRVALVLPVA